MKEREEKCFVIKVFNFFYSRKWQRIRNKVDELVSDAHAIIVLLPLERNLLNYLHQSGRSHSAFPEGWNHQEGSIHMPSTWCLY